MPLRAQFDFKMLVKKLCTPGKVSSKFHEIFWIYKRIPWWNSVPRGGNTY